jgi:DNA-binding transcriptional LysR family regulator
MKNEPVVQNHPGLANAPLGAVLTFECVARHLRFARAATELRVTPTAISKSIAQLEEHLGVRLLHRTTRSVSLTEAGARLMATVTPALTSLQRGFEEARAIGDSPAGTLRISTSYVAFATLFAPHLRGFLAEYPRIAPEFSIDSAPRDIVAGGFDVGVRPGRAVQHDMIGIPIGPVQRLIVVGAPGYLARAGRPRTPNELLGHACIRQRFSAGSRMIEWTLRAGRAKATLDVKGPLVLDDMRAVLDAARQGNGLGYVFEQFAAPDLASGTLEHVLPTYALVREAFFLYYSSRHNLPPKLRAFVDWFRSKHDPDRTAAGS